MPAIDLTVLTVLMPATPREPMVILENGAALRMVVVNRESISQLEPEWETPGLYVLLYPVPDRANASPDRRPGIYIGKTGPGGLRGRLLTHSRARDGWLRALLIARDTSAGFNAGHVGWLESRLWSVADVAAQVRLVNDNRPRDETLELFERSWLEGTVEPIRQTMRLLGYPLDPPDDDPPPKDPRKHHGVTVSQLMEAGILRAADEIEYTGRGHEGKRAQLESDGSIIVDGARFTSPSAAGAKVRGGAVNGWGVWARRGADGELVTLGELRARLKREV